jgi:hypothetical protein
MQIWHRSEWISPSNDWKVYFEVKISGGDGCSYLLYWEGERVSYEVKPSEPDVAVLVFDNRRHDEGMLVGTIGVESGGQRAEEPTSASRP